MASARLLRKKGLSMKFQDDDLFFHPSSLILNSQYNPTLICGRSSEKDDATEP
jgi:hypothetical protein